MESKKLCPRCQKNKPVSQFGFRRSGSPRSWCKPCQSAYRKEHYQARSDYYKAKAYTWNKQRRKEMRASIMELKKAPCVDCGRSYPPWVMEYDHTNGKKVRNISRMVTHSVGDRVLNKELKKCELVCSNCHSNRTHSRREGIEPPRYWEAQ